MSRRLSGMRAFGRKAGFESFMLDWRQKLRLMTEQGGFIIREKQQTPLAGLGFSMCDCGL